MAFNWQTFRTRTGTAIIFAVVMLAGMLWNQWLFLMLFSIIHFGCWYEYQQLLEKIDPDYKQITPFHRYGVMIAGWCILLFFTGNDSFSDVLSLHAIAWWVGLVLILVLPIMELLFSRHINLRNIRHSILGLLYISLSFGLLVQMRWEDLRLPILIIFSIWINDTMAYIVGSLIGKTPLSTISPKKTWEGTIGGIMLSVLVMAIVVYTTNYFYSLTHSVIIALIAAVAGTFGDLLESKVKRMANVKDSGSFMPGHGGFLDRFDSILLATPFVWIYVNLFLR